MIIDMCVGDGIISIIDFCSHEFPWQLLFVLRNDRNQWLLIHIRMYNILCIVMHAEAQVVVCLLIIMIPLNFCHKAIYDFILYNLYTMLIDVVLTQIIMLIIHVLILLLYMSTIHDYLLLLMCEISHMENDTAWNVFISRPTLNNLSRKSDGAYFVVYRAMW